jgi:hypothetical protein
MGPRWGANPADVKEPFNERESVQPEGETYVRRGGCAGDRGVHLSHRDPPRPARARHHLHPAPHTLMLEAFTHETFAGHEGEAFPIRLDDGSALETRLQSARTWGSGSDGHRVPFTLTFVGPMQPVLPQRIYRLEHPEVGAFDLFLVPVGPNAQGMQYEAVFT